MHLRKTPFAQFVFNIAGKDMKRFKAFVTMLGFLMHRYQMPSRMKAVILLDEAINELNAAMGGVGKSLLTKSLGFIRDVCELSGKDFTSSYKFAYQRVTSHTNIICINDIKQNENFENYFGRVTDGFTINRKYKKEEQVEAKYIPKMLFTSNYVMKRPDGYSSERRMYEIELSDHYGKHLTVYQDFNQHFFEKWSEEQWHDFTLFMVFCISFYLKHGLVEAPQVNLIERRAISEIGIELLEFLDEKFAKKSKHHKMELFKEFITGDYVSYKYRPTARTFTVKLKKYCDYKNLKYRETPSNTKAFIEIVTEQDEVNYTTIKDVDTDYKTVDTANKMTRMVNAMTKHFAQADNKVLALHFENTDLDPLTDEAVSLALSFKPRTGFNIIFPTNAVKRNKFIAPLLPFLADDTITKVFHNAKFDLKFFYKLNIQLGGEIADTMVMDYTLDPSRKKHGLKAISKLHLNYKHIEFEQMLGNKKITEVDDKDLTNYAVEDADLTLQLYYYLTKKLQ